MITLKVRKVQGIQSESRCRKHSSKTPRGHLIYSNKSKDLLHLLKLNSS